MNIQSHYKDITLAYYDMWIGKEGILSDASYRAKFVYCNERNIVQCGYVQPFDIYVFATADKVIVSYGDKAKSKIENIRDSIDTFNSIDDLKLAFKTVYCTDVMHNVKYVFNGIKTSDSRAKVLCKNDYEQYEEFFIKCNPSYNNSNWLKDYFEEMVSENLCLGVYEGGFLVSCTDAPEMAYMSDMVQEIGINTLLGYRGRGYAAIACQSCINEIINNGKVPQWSTSITNIASQKLAEKLGFVKLGDVITMTL